MAVVIIPLCWLVYKAGTEISTSYAVASVTKGNFTQGHVYKIVEFNEDGDAMRLWHSKSKTGKWFDDDEVTFVTLDDLQLRTIEKEST